MKKNAGLTRRDAVILAASPAALAAQTSGTTAPVPASAAVPDEAEVAHKNRVRTAEQLKKIKLPISVEPSFSFHA